MITLADLKKAKATMADADFQDAPAVEIDGVVYFAEKKPIDLRLTLQQTTGIKLHDRPISND